MKILKGLIGEYLSVNIFNLFSNDFNEYLLKLHKITIKELQNSVIEVNEPLIKSTRLLFNEFNRDKRNFKLTTSFINSGEVDYNDYYGSFKDYLIKLYLASEKLINNQEFIKKIEKTLEELIKEKSEYNLYLDICGISRSRFCIQKIGLENVGLDLKSINFIEESDSETIKGTGFYFNEQDNLSITCIYKTIFKNDNLLLNDEISNELLKDIIINYKNELSSFEQEKLKKIEIDLSLRLALNKELISQEVNYNLKPILFFNSSINERIYRTTQNGSINGEQQECILNIINQSSEIENSLYNNQIKPEITIIHFKKGEDDLMVFNKTKDELMAGVIYKVTTGNLSLKEVYHKNNELIEKGIKNHINLIKASQIFN